LAKVVSLANAGYRLQMTIKLFKGGGVGTTWEHPVPITGVR